jgi:hypothetical protein
MLAKTFAGILLGLPLSMALVSVAVWVWPRSSESVVIPMMAIFFPLWIGIMAGTYLFRSGVRAWAWLAAANLGTFAALYLVKHSMPGL